MNQAASVDNLTTVERVSDCELVVTRTVSAPAEAVFAAWTRPELFARWWTPASFRLTILECDMDVRPGGTYRLLIQTPFAEQPMTFFGRYLEVTPPVRLAWTNEEGGEDGAVTTVSFEDRGDETLIVLHDRYPSKEALEDAMASGATSGFGEQFGQLDTLLATGAAG